MFTHRCYCCVSLRVLHRIRLMRLLAAVLVAAATVVSGHVAVIREGTVRVGRGSGVQRDSRWIFSIESFGFLEGGKLKLSVENFQIPGLAPTGQSKAGFILYRTDTEASVVESVQGARESQTCLLDEEPSSSAHVLRLDRAERKIEHTFDIQKEGLYDLIFTRCEPRRGRVSLDVRAEFVNPGNDYLGAGDRPLPWMYITMSFVFMGALAAWLYICRKNRGQLHTIHHMFTVLAVFKCLSLLFEGIMFHSIRTTGQPVGYNVVYYILNFCKGLLMFTVIALVGTGWSLVKPFLNKNEKKVFLIVIPLQILNNIGIIMVDEMAPGSGAYDIWRTILHMADLACCVIVLLPVVWSIRQLRSAAAADGKARETLNRLTQFRSFYMATVAYIYFTRIIVYIMQATLTFRAIWVAPFFAELASLMFFLVVGYYFRPGSNNPYVRVPTDSMDDDEEFGLEDGDEVDTSLGSDRDRRPARGTAIDV